MGDGSPFELIAGPINFLEDDDEMGVQNWFLKIGSSIICPLFIPLHVNHSLNVDTLKRWKREGFAIETLCHRCGMTMESRETFAAMAFRGTHNECVVYLVYAMDDVTYNTSTTAGWQDGKMSAGTTGEMKIKKGSAMVQMIECPKKGFKPTCIGCLAQMSKKDSSVNVVLKSVLMKTKGKCNVVNSDFVLKEAQYGDI